MDGVGRGHLLIKYPIDETDPFRGSVEIERLRADVHTFAGDLVTTEGPVFQFLYKSTATMRVTDAGLGHIQAQAVRNNQAHEITWFLLHARQTFVQLLEGHPLAMTEVPGRVVHGPRHRDIVVLHTGLAEERSASAWSMGVFTEGDHPTVPKPDGSLATLLHMCRAHNWQSYLPREAIDRALRAAA